MTQRRACTFGIFCPFAKCHNLHAHSTDIAVATRVASELYPLEFVQQLERFHEVFPNAKDGLACYEDKARRDYAARVALRHHDFYVARQVALSVLHAHVDDPQLHAAICTTVIEDGDPTRVATRNVCALRGATELDMRPRLMEEERVTPASTTTTTTTSITTTTTTTFVQETTTSTTTTTTSANECMHCFDELDDVAYVIQHADGRTACGMWCHACHLHEGYAHKKACPRCNSAVHATQQWREVRLDCTHVHDDVRAEWRDALKKQGVFC